MDLHYLREVRHLDTLLAYDRLSDSPETFLPEATHASLPAGYRAARGHVTRTVAPLANARRREWAGRMQKQIARMSAYYAQLPLVMQRNCEQRPPPSLAGSLASRV
jgi:hypothetical protein